MSKVNILGVQVDPVCLDDILGTVKRVIEDGDRAIIAHVNIRGINIALEQDWYRQFLNSVDLLYCDGIGVKLGARFLGKHIPRRLTLADWVWELADFSAMHGFSMYLLGNPPGVALNTARKLKERYPTLQIVGTQHGFFNQTKGSIENIAALDQINAGKPDILMVGFGMPDQERWLLENWSELNVHISITCGALFEVIAGDINRGPDWMTQYYLEWLARILITPRRYGKRYFYNIPLFTYHLVRHKFFPKVRK